MFKSSVAVLLALTFFLGSFQFLIFPHPAWSQSDYLLGPEDVVEVTVWGHEDLKRLLPVSLDGNLTFPMIGEVRAAGKSTQTLEKELARLLASGFLVNPQITVTVKEYKSQKVFVMGEVTKPGTYPVTKQNNLLFVLSQAEGPTKEAGEEIVIIRPRQPVKQGLTLEEAESRNESLIKVNLKEALAGDRQHNISIRDGDSILVTKIPYFFVMGEVKNPGRYNLERGTTVLMGISLGGGLTPKAASGRTRIVREVEGKKTEIRVGMEALLRPGDTLIIPESFF